MKTALALLSLTLLAGCDPAPSPLPPSANDSSRALERAVQEPLDKARAVEDQIQVEKARQDREIEEGGG